jgi:two-component system, cell cycle sensor histidine kinase and response regulator CckA
VLREFIAFPIVHGGDLVGMMAVADRPGGYEGLDPASLMPLLNTCGSIIQSTRVERERRDAEERLAASQHMLETVLNNIPQGVYWKDLDSVYLGCNSVVSSSLGLQDPSDLVGRSDFDLPGITPEQARSFIRTDRAVIESGTPQLGLIQPVSFGDDQIAWLESNKMPLRDSRGEIIGILGTWSDITEKRRLEDQLRQSQKMEAFGQLAAGVAHDFNNLLTVISGYSDILLMKLPPDDPRRPAVDSIADAGARAAALTRQLLAFTRLTVLDPRVLDLNSVVTDMEDMFRRLVGEEIALETKLSGDLDRIQVDASQIGQVLLNLVINARDAMPLGGMLTIESRNIQLDAGHASPHPDVRPGRYVLLTISDTGTGIPGRDLGRIFEPFFTTKGAGKGTGLGLAVVHGIVKQSGGAIDVYSEPDKGTEFRVYLPAVGEHPPGRDVNRDAAQLVGQETVLLVEDEDAVRSLARSALEQSGYKVLEAVNGLAAIEVAEGRRGPIDLLVTDVVMPGMDGGQLADTLRVRIPGIRVLFISGYTDDAVVRHGILHEHVAFLQKPFSPAALAAKVRAVLEGAGDDHPLL